MKRQAREEGKERKTSTETESLAWKENIQRKLETDFHLCKRLMSEYAILSYENFRQRNRHIYYMKQLVDLGELTREASKQVCI